MQRAAMPSSFTTAITTLKRYAGSFPTGGAGSGGGLGNQGGLILSSNHKWLFAVNAGSNEISVFQVTQRGITLRDIVPSSGIRPVSLTFYRGLFYVLNAGSDSIAGFTLGRDGDLHPLPTPHTLSGDEHRACANPLQRRRRSVSREREGDQQTHGLSH
ncbi:MAG: hypothetical protein U0Y68_13950 [Blastocatellia bacterium]